MQRILGDWGTTRLRLFRAAADGTRDRLDGPGFGELTGAPDTALLALLAQWGDGPSRIALCGMAGARGGLIEAPYASCPVSLDDWRAHSVHQRFGQNAVTVAAGLRILDRDVMRGEETQVFGAMVRHPDLQSAAQTILLPGTHSKWVAVANGVITGFRTFFTGEMFALLRRHSTLFKAAALAGTAQDHDEGWHAGLDSAQQGAAVLGAVFETRVAQLLRGRSQQWAAGYLSGLLIGSEIAEGLALGTAAGAIVVIGAPSLTAHYAAAFDRLNVPHRLIDGDDAVLAGLELIDDTVG